MLQAILEKFEFFPIKCRVQRALELFKATCKRRENIVDKHPMKQKVATLNNIISIMVYGTVRINDTKSLLESNICPLFH
jgi:hypothetical protein